MCMLRAANVKHRSQCMPRYLPLMPSNQNPFIEYMSVNLTPVPTIESAFASPFSTRIML